MRGVVWLLVATTTTTVHAYTCPPCVGASCGPSSWVNRGAHNVSGGALPLDVTTLRHRTWSFKTDAVMYLAGSNFGGTDYVYADWVGDRTGGDIWQSYIKFPANIPRDEFIWDMGNNVTGSYMGFRTPNTLRIRAGRADVLYSAIGDDAIGCEGNIQQFLDGLVHEIVWWIDSGAWNAVTNTPLSGSRIGVMIDNTVVCDVRKSTTLIREGNMPVFTSSNTAANFGGFQGTPPPGALPLGENTNTFSGKVDHIRVWDGIIPAWPLASHTGVSTEQIPDAYNTLNTAVNLGRMRDATVPFGYSMTTPLAVVTGDIAVDFWFRTNGNGHITTATINPQSNNQNPNDVAVQILSVRWIMDIANQWHFRSFEILISLRPSSPGGIDLMYSANPLQSTTSFWSATRLARFSSLPYGNTAWHRYTLQFHRQGTRVAFWFDGRVMADVALPMAITGVAQPVVTFNLAAANAGNTVIAGLNNLAPLYMTDAYITQNFHSCGTNTVVNTDYCLNASWPICSVDSCSTNLLPASFTRQCTVANAECRADTCTCASGWTGNGFSNCTDINECTTGTHACGALHTVCTNSPPGSHTCSCLPGFVGNGVVCEDINECSENRCHANATCVNSPGTFACQCKPGFTGNGQNLCNDVNECTLGTHDCAANATCSNTVGSFTCACNNTGYTGAACTEDVNECLTSSPCSHRNMVCGNTDGSFTCTCIAGYTGVNCSQDINECERDTNNCGDNTVCANTAGSFTCVCDDGFSRVSADECSSAFRQHQRAIGSVLVCLVALLLLLV